MTLHRKPKPVSAALHGEGLEVLARSSEFPEKGMVRFASVEFDLQAHWLVYREDYATSDGTRLQDIRVKPIPEHLRDLTQGRSYKFHVFH